MAKLQNMTMREYITMKAIQYPTLWASHSYEFSKILVLDHLLTTLGNGITFDMLLDNSKKSKKNKELLKKDSGNLFNNTNFYYIRAANSNHFEDLTHPVTGEKIDCLTLEEIKSLGWDTEEYIYFSANTNKRNLDNWHPYPTFKKEYSILWKNKESLHLLPQDFLREFINYYDEVYNFFSTDRKYLYSYACPKPNEDKKWEKTLKEWQDIFEKATKDIPEEQKNAHFEKQYAFPFDGDMKKFLTERFVQEVQNNLNFIYETIRLLDDTIKQQDESEAIKIFNTKQLKKLKKTQNFDNILQEKPTWDKAPEFAKSLGLKIIDGEEFGNWCWMAGEDTKPSYGFTLIEKRPS